MDVPLSETWAHGDYRARPARATDVAFLRDLHRAAYFDVVTTMFGGWDTPLQDVFFKRSLALPNTFVITDAGGESVGAYALWQEEGMLQLTEIQLLPAVQSRGIGSALISWVLEHAASQRIGVRLQVLREDRAHSLYARLGFTQIGSNGTHFIMQMDPATMP